MIISLAVSHTPWIPERVESMQRLRGALGPWLKYREVTDRAPNHVWSETMWRWAAETDADWCLFAQDDVILAPRFKSILHAMVEAVPDQIIGFETVHPHAAALAEEGAHWCTTSDGLIGVLYGMPRPILEEFLRWRASALVPGAVEKITEDTLVNLFALATGRKVWHPIPAVHDHDTTLLSTYGNDDHSHRRPQVRWDTRGWLGRDAARSETLERPSWWKSGPPLAHLGRFYEATPELARASIAGFTEAQYLAAKGDDGHAVKRAISLRARARNTSERPKHRIVICTPTRGGVHPEYAASVWRLAYASDEVLVQNGEELLSAWQWSDDLVRARSRFVHRFLETDATHLLFVDGDISFRPVVLRGMLAARRDFVACPYPKRDAIDFEAIANAEDPRPLEARGYKYPIRVELDTPGQVDDQGCTEIAGIGLGCALLSRACLERMTEHYRAELEFDDLLQGKKTPMVALFALIHRNRELLSEDFSFCMRWRAMGEKVWMYLGEGSPVDHHGSHHYRGRIEALGMRRT